MKTNINSQALKLAHKLKALYASNTFWRALREAYGLLKSPVYIAQYIDRLQRLEQLVRLPQTLYLIDSLIKRLSDLWTYFYEVEYLD